MNLRALFNLRILRPGANNPARPTAPQTDPWSPPPSITYEPASDDESILSLTSVVDSDILPHNPPPSLAPSFNPPIPPFPSFQPFPEQRRIRHPHNPSIRKICTTRIHQSRESLLHPSPQTYHPISLLPDIYTLNRYDYESTPWVMDHPSSHPLKPGAQLMVDGWGFGKLGSVRYLEQSSLIFEIGDWGDETRRWQWTGLLAIPIAWLSQDDFANIILAAKSIERVDTTAALLRATREHLAHIDAASQAADAPTTWTGTL